MISHMLFPSLFTLLFSFLHLQPGTSSNDGPKPVFVFSWLDDKDTFMAGDTASIKIRVLGNYERGKYEFPFNPNITINDKMGNSSFVSGISLDFDGETENWRICFTPIMVGLFNVLISDDHFHVFDSSMHFQVNPGHIYPAAGILSWMDGVNEFMAGTKAQVLILPKDAFGNNVSSSNEGSILHNFVLLASTLHGFPANILNITNKGWNQQGYLNIEFVAATAGHLLLHAQVDNQTLQGSPMDFIVIPGNLDPYSCLAQWNVETKYFQLFSIIEGLIHQHDQYGNVVSEPHVFEIEIVEKGTSLSLPVADIRFKDVGPGVQSFSFGLLEPGNFSLMISTKDQDKAISNMPFDFTVYIGYCDGINSIVNGSGLNDSVAGVVAKFSIFLKDAYLYPSPVNSEILQVQIVHESYPVILHPTIQTKEAANGSFIHYDLMQIAPAPAPAIDPKEDPRGIENSKASSFEVIYKPEISGLYEIHVFCGNIPLNSGHPFQKEVSPGKVNMSISGVVEFSDKVSKMIENKIVIQLMDSYRNPVLLQESKLKLEIASLNRSVASSSTFSGSGNGSYTVSYVAKEVGTYEICASYDGEQFMPCPFGVNVYNNEYFPKANNDTVRVWEDESMAFDVLQNDYFAGGNASILEYSKPGHGALLQHGNFFRYTPYKRFYGNDSFTYTIADLNGNHASGAVDLLILCIPPQFSSIPIDLQATEDLLSPMFGGFSGFEIVYSDLSESITVTLSSQSGTVSLSPTTMQFWQPKWNEFSVRKDVNNNTLYLTGHIDAINFALQAIQYFGNENFYGDDAIRVSTINRNGRNDLDVPIHVYPINDPPVINIPPFVILDDTSDDGILIFGGRRDALGFIGDPDLVNFPGNRSRFKVMLSLEVSSGFMSTSLPSELIDSTELKLKTNYHWQPLQTFVTISKHFLVKAKAIRFRGTIDDCNSVMENLKYHEGKHGAVLAVTVNDLGNHGCFPDCGEMISAPLFAESTVNLLRQRPISSLAAHALGSAVIIESIAVAFLGLLLLFFICKCAVILVREKKRQKVEYIELSNMPGPSKRPKEKPFCPLPFFFRSRPASQIQEVNPKSGPRSS